MGWDAVARVFPRARSLRPSLGAEPVRCVMGALALCSIRAGETREDWAARVDRSYGGFPRDATDLLIEAASLAMTPRMSREAWAQMALVIHDDTMRAEIGGR